MNHMQVKQEHHGELRKAGAPSQRNRCTNVFLESEFYRKRQGQRFAFVTAKGVFFFFLYVFILSAQESKEALLRHASPMCFPLATVLSDDEK